MVTLENEFLAASFDEHARLVGLRCREGGLPDAVAAPSADSFRIVFRQGSDWEHTAAGGDQEFRVSAEKSRATFTAETLRTAQGDAAIRVRLTAELQGDRLIFGAEIENRCDALITDFEYPITGRILSFGRRPPALYWPWESGKCFTNANAYLAGLPSHRESHAHSVSMTYPGEAGMQWMALSDGTATLYLAGRDADLYATELRAQGGADAAGVALVIDKMPFVKTGETWTAPQAALMYYPGTWHRGARDYRDWSAPLRPKHMKPKWIEDMAGFFLVINKQQFGHEMWSYDTLPELYRMARAHGCDTLGLFGWYDSGHDNRYPDLSVSETLGGAEALRENIRKVQQAGGRVVLYFQGHLIDPSTDFYKNGGKELEMLSHWGTPYTEHYHKSHVSGFLKDFTFKWFSLACPSCPEWRELMRAKTDYISSFGPDGVLFDQIGGMPPYPCFNDRHPHAGGKPSLSLSRGRVKLLDAVQKRTKEHDASFAFFSEHITDAYSAYLDALHGIGTQPGRPGGRAEAARDGDIAEAHNYPELFRFCFPDVVITVRNSAPYLSPRMVNFAFAFGLRYEMEIRYQKDKDDVLAQEHADWRDYAAAVTALRRRYWDLLAYGEFVDDLPLTLGNRSLIAKAYVNGERLAVALWNDTGEDQPIELDVPGYRFAEAATEEGSVHRPDRLAPQRIAVLLYRK